MNNNSKLIIGLVAIVLLIGAFSMKNWNSVGLDDSSGTVAGDAVKVTLYKSPTCGCCVKYTAYLKKNGFNVEIITTTDTSSIKEEQGVPVGMESCHTLVIGDYFVEGHIPVEAIEKLLTEKPDIDGIALPGMPSGSPGMPGIKRGAFDIRSVSGGLTSEFISI